MQQVKYYWIYCTESWPLRIWFQSQYFAEQWIYVEQIYVSFLWKQLCNTWRFEQAYCCYSQWTELTLCSSNSTLLSETEISSASNLDHRKRKINLQTDSSNETSKRKKVEQKNFVCSTCGLSYTVNKNLLRHIRNKH